MPLYPASGCRIFRWLPCGVTRRESLDSQNAPRAPVALASPPDRCSVTLTDVPASSGQWAVEGARPVVRRPWVPAPALSPVWPLRVPSLSSSCVLTSKTSRLGRWQRAALRSLLPFWPLHFIPPLLPRTWIPHPVCQLGPCSLFVEWSPGKTLWEQEEESPGLGRSVSVPGPEFPHQRNEVMPVESACRGICTRTLGKRGSRSPPLSPTRPLASCLARRKKWWPSSPSLRSFPALKGPILYLC